MGEHPCHDRHALVATTLGQCHGPAQRRRRDDERGGRGGRRLGALHVALHEVGPTQQLGGPRQHRPLGPLPEDLLGDRAGLVGAVLEQGPVGDGQAVDELVLADLAQLVQVEGGEGPGHHRAEQEAVHDGEHRENAGDHDRHDLGSPPAPTPGGDVAHVEEDLATVEGQHRDEVQDRPTHVDPDHLAQDHAGVAGGHRAGPVEQQGRHAEQQQGREGAGQAHDDPLARGQLARAAGEAAEAVQQDAGLHAVGPEGDGVAHLVQEHRHGGDQDPRDHVEPRLREAEQHEHEEERRLDAHGDARHLHPRSSRHGDRLRPSPHRYRSRPCPTPRPTR